MSWFSEIVDQAKRAVEETPSSLLSTFTTLGLLRGINPLGGGGSDFSDMQQKYADRGTRLAKEINDADMSPTIKKELLAMGERGEDYIRAELVKAKGNEGRYGILNRSYRSQQLYRNRPGAIQLFSSSASRMNAQNGVISQNSQNSLLVPKG